MERRDFLKLSAAGITLPLLSATVGCSDDADNTIDGAIQVLEPNLEELQPKRVISENGVLKHKMSIEMGTPSVNGQILNVRSYNGVFPPETMVVRPGDEMRIHLVNNLPKTDEDNYHPDNINIPHGFNNVNLHTHGLNVSPAADEDNVLLVIKPGEEFTFHIKIPEDHPCGTFWYHPHKHGSALHQLASGMAGFLMIEGSNDDLKKLPELQNATSIDLAFHEIIVDPTGRVPAEGNGEASEIPVNHHPVIEDRNPVASLFKGEAKLLYTINGHSIDDGDGGPNYNGKVAYIRMQPGEVQHWRLGLHCHLQGYRFVMEGHDLHIAGWDGITAHEIEVYPPDLDAEEKLIMGPADRVDILVKAKMEPGTYAFKMVPEKFGETEIVVDEFGNTIPLFQTPRPGLPELAVFNVIVEGEPNDMPLPTKLAPPIERLPAITDSEIVRKRMVKFKVEGGVEFGETGFVKDSRKYYINHVQFDANRTNQTMVLGTAEEWTIENPHHDHGNGLPFPQINHPFHIHVNWFQLMELHHHDGRVEKFDGTQNPVRWLDTIDVPFGGKAIIRHRFEKFTGRFVFHCHIIAHEDEGMMQLIEVVDGKPQSVSINAGEKGILYSEDNSKIEPDVKAWLEERHALPPVKVAVEFEPDTFADVGNYEASYQYKVGPNQAQATTDAPANIHEPNAIIPGTSIVLDDPQMLPPPVQMPEGTKLMAGLERCFKLATTAGITKLEKPIKITIHYPKLLGHLNDSDSITYKGSTAELYYSDGTQWANDNLRLIEHDEDKAKLIYELSNDLGNGYFSVFGERTGTVVMAED